MSNGQQKTAVKILSFLGEVLMVFLRALTSGVTWLVGFIVGGALLGVVGGVAYGYSIITMALIGAVAGFFLAIFLFAMIGLDL